MQRDLVERAMAGDHDAFSELARVSIGRLYVVARLILRDDKGAEDATQEALVAAWRRLDGLRDPDRFEAWLHRLLVNACYREARRSRRRGSIEIHVEPLAMPEASQGPTGTSTSPIAINSSAASDASTSISERCSSCTTTSGSASTKRRRSWAFHRDRPLAAPSRDQCDARRPRGRRPTPMFSQGRSA